MGKRGMSAEIGSKGEGKFKGKEKTGIYAFPKSGSDFPRRVRTR